MAEETQIAEENVGLNLSAVARILMTPTTAVRTENITVDGNSSVRHDENHRLSPPVRSTPLSTSTTATIITPSTSTARLPSPTLQRPSSPGHRQQDDTESNDPGSDIEIDVSALDDCLSPTDFSVLNSDLSPDSYEYSPLAYTTSGGYYKCRFCSFSTMTYTHLQLHMPKHGGLKALKCPLCDYTTSDKSNFRRHRRLHNRSNPATVLRCGKCEFTTVLPRKIREHYCHEHNEDYNSNLPQVATSASIVIPGYTDTHFNGSQHIDIAQGHCSSTALSQGHCTVTGVSVGTGGLHSLLTTGPTPGIQFARANPLMPNCINQFTYETPNHRVHEDRSMASDYLRSIVSNIIPAPRVPATSTITSSSFYLPHVVESSQDIMSPTNQKTNRQYHMTDDEQKMKFKSEPLDNEDISDVSSSAIPLVIHSREVPRPMEAQTTQRLSIDIYDSNLHPDHNNEDFSSSSQIYSDSSSRRKYSRGSTSHNISIKCETSHIGIQCSLPVIKREPIDSELNSSDSRNRSQVYLISRGVQCELLTQRTANRSNVDSVENSESRCSHCGITFEDEVLFSIHIGCHSHTDPFVCNVCGKQCINKYGFYSHIMRGHQC